MKRAGEIHCYLCGEILGTWEWPATASPEQGLFRPFANESRATAGWLGSLRCLRCGGSVYLEAVAPVRVRDLFDIETLKRPRHRRPPKRQPLAS